MTIKNVKDVNIPIMNNRTRIINTVLMKDIDRQPFFFFFGPWSETLQNWKIQGLPQDSEWDCEIDFDPGIRMINVDLGYLPAFTPEVIEERETTLVIRDDRGILQETRKVGSSIPNFIDYPVKDRESWETLKKERLDPNDPNRFPENWDELADEYNTGDHAMQIGSYPYGLFGSLRDMMGVETLLVSFYDDPELIHEMMEYLTDFWLKIYEKVCSMVKIDIIHMWEDMSGKTGSLISPAMVREFMMPHYKKIRKFADDHNIPIFSLDTDGNCEELVPLFLECGINLIFPFEVAAGSDILEYRRRYPNLCIMGGIDKREISKGPHALEKELDRIDSMFNSPGYIPSIDHLFPPEVTYTDFKDFSVAIKKRIDKYKGLT